MAIKVLDHGYVKSVEHWGNDSRIIEAARMSTNKGFQGWGREDDYICTKCDYIVGLGFDQAVLDACECRKGGFCDFELRKHPAGDEKLLRYLWEHKHATPFEMAGLVIEVQAPIFVFREWHRHRTQSYNEMSARYTPLPNVNYIPTIDRLMVNSKTNKQAGVIKGAHELTEDQAQFYIDTLNQMYIAQESLYQAALQAGVPKELARIHLPVGRYSRMRASANLRNWFAFLSLRMDANAQWEIREFANAVAVLIEQRFPRSYALFNEGMTK